MERYRLQFWDRSQKVLAIQFVGKGHVPGDFYVRALREATNVNAHNKAHSQNQSYTSPYSLDQARSFIEKVGDVGRVHDCLGLGLEDELRYVYFDDPILIRNMSEPVSPAPRKEVDAAAIKYQRWIEDTYHMLSAVWGDEKARVKLAEYRPPQELLDQLGPEEIKLSLIC